MNLDNFIKVFEGLPAFRLRQAKEAVFQHLIDDWSQASVLPQNLRQQLHDTCPLRFEGKFFVGRSSVKATLTLRDGAVIETVLLRHKSGRNTICVSSQAGCACACAFCATGEAGLTRNLTAGEIVAQVLLMARWLKAKHQDKITNLVFMGMGEPLLNYRHVKEAINWLHDGEAFNLGWRHMSLSTCGIAPALKNLAKDFPQINLAVSLHAPNDRLRSELMPINNTYNLATLLKAVDEHIAIAGREVMFAYTLIKGINDSEALAKELAKLMKKKLYVVNLISYHPTGKFSKAGEETLERFYEILKQARVKVTKRGSLGEDILGACGQLAARPFA